MTYDDILKYYGNPYRAWKKHNLAMSNFKNWKRYGYIPINTQLKIQKLTNGELIADLDHAEK